MNKINEKNIKELRDVFKRCVKEFYERKPGFPNSSYYFHKKVMGMIREMIKNKKSYNALFKDELFLERVYATVALWGMDRMDGGARMVEFDDFKESVRRNLPLLNRLSKYKLDSMKKEDVDDIKPHLGKLFDRLKVMEGKRLIGVSKAMHHLLPDLVPPMDGKYTLRFFYKDYRKYKEGESISVPDITPENEKGVFLEIFGEYRKICRKLDKSTKSLNGEWNTSIPKLIDNAIIGFVYKKYK